jgi:hypothetical protein
VYTAEAGLSKLRSAAIVRGYRLDHCLRFARYALLFTCFAICLVAQELQPRAYLPAPVGLNYFGISYANNRGGLLVDPGLALEDVRFSANASTLAFGQTLGLAGRTVQVLACVPYVVAEGVSSLNGAQIQTRYSGLGDVTLRYAMNLYGAPAMGLKEFRAYRQKTIVGASITVAAPTGQYDPNRTVNLGLNRWAFKPEIGLSRAVGNYTFEGAAGVWLYKANNRFNGSSERRQVPLGSLQFHIERSLPRRMWAAVDWTLYTGGRTQIDGKDNADYQGNTRLGATWGWTLHPRHAIKVIYFRNVIARVGSDMRSVGVSYNFIWLRGR